MKKMKKLFLSTLSALMVATPFTLNASLVAYAQSYGSYVDQEAINAVLFEEDDMIFFDEAALDELELRLKYELKQPLVELPRDRLGVGVAATWVFTRLVSGLSALTIGGTTFLPRTTAQITQTVNVAFNTSVMNLGNINVGFTRAQMVHTASRHLPNQWGGVVKARNGFFAPNTSFGTIRDVAFSISRHNATQIHARGGTGTFRQTIGGTVFELYMRNGNIITVYPVQ